MGKLKLQTEMPSPNRFRVIGKKLFQKINFRSKKTRIVVSRIDHKLKENNLRKYFFEEKK